METNHPLIPLNGIDFIEYSSSNPDQLERLFEQMGFVKTATHRDKDVLLYTQGECHFVINKQPNSFAEDFTNQRKSPCVSSIGFRVDISADKSFGTSLQIWAQKKWTEDSCKPQFSSYLWCRKFLSSIL